MNATESNPYNRIERTVAESDYRYFKQHPDETSYVRANHSGRVRFGDHVRSPRPSPSCADAQRNARPLRT